MKNLNSNTEESKNDKLKFPVTYDGWMIGKVYTPYNGIRLCAYNFKTEIFLNPLYGSWRALKLVIDALKPQ